MLVPFWDKVDKMVRVSAQVACVKIYRAYGQHTSITSILRSTQQDSKSGIWPAALCNAHSNQTIMHTKIENNEQILKSHRVALNFGKTFIVVTSVGLLWQIHE